MLLVLNYSCQKFKNADLTYQSLKAIHFFYSSKQYKTLKTLKHKHAPLNLQAIISVTYFCSLPFCFPPIHQIDLHNQCLDLSTYLHFLCSSFLLASQTFLLKTVFKQRIRISFRDSLLIEKSFLFLLFLKIFLFYHHL